MQLNPTSLAEVLWLFYLLLLSYCIVRYLSAICISNRIELVLDFLRKHQPKHVVIFLENEDFAAICCQNSKIDWCIAIKSPGIDMNVDNGFCHRRSLISHVLKFGQSLSIFENGFQFNLILWIFIWIHYPCTVAPIAPTDDNESLQWISVWPKRQSMRQSALHVAILLNNALEKTFEKKNHCKYI